MVSFFVWMIVRDKKVLNCNILIRLITLVTNNALLIKRENKFVGWCCMCSIVGRQWDIFCYTIVLYLSSEILFFIRSMSATKKGHQPFIWSAELDIQVFFEYLEFGYVMFDIDIKTRI